MKTPAAEWLRFCQNFHLLLPPILFVLLGVAVPMVYLFAQAAGADLASLREIVFRARNLELLFNTLALAAVVLLGGTLLAAPLALLAVRSDFRPKALLALAGVMPLAIPGYVAAFAFVSAAGHGGALERIFGLEIAPPSGFWGAAMVLALYTFPYLFLNLCAGLRSGDGATEDAARLLGASELRVFFSVTLPALLPAYMAGALLVVLHVLADFAVVGTMRYSTFSASIYQQYTAAYDTVYSAWLVLMLLGLTFLAVWLESRVLRGLRLQRVGVGSAKRPRIVRLGRWYPAALVFVLLLTLLAVGVPLASVLHSLLVLGRGVSHDDFWKNATSTISVALVAAPLAAMLAFPLAYVGARWRGNIARQIERMAYLSYAIAPIAFALAVVMFVLGVVPPLYQTFGLLIAAYALHFTAEAIGPLRSALLLAAPRLEEAAQTLGSSKQKSLFDVVLPIVLSGFGTGTALVFLSVIKELPLTLLLSPLGFETLAYSAWSYSGEGMYAEAAPYALALMALGAIASLFVLRKEKDQ